MCIVPSHWLDRELKSALLNFHDLVPEQFVNDDYSLQSSYTVTGLCNIGNSCYLNSGVQLLNSLSVVREVVTRHASQHSSAGMSISIVCL